MNIILDPKVSENSGSIRGLFSESGQEERWTGYLNACDYHRHSWVSHSKHIEQESQCRWLLSMTLSPIQFITTTSPS